VKIKSLTGENKPFRPEGLVEYSHVIVCRRDARAQIFRWSRAELDLAAWLQRQETITGHRPWTFKIVQNRSNHLKWDWQRWIGSIANQPLKLGSDDSWWARLEADCSDMSLGLQLGKRKPIDIGLGADRVGAGRLGGQYDHRFHGEYRATPGTYSANHLPARLIPDVLAQYR
jgi:hypothetical protein